jgi:hypothetical protein
MSENPVVTLNVISAADGVIHAPNFDSRRPACRNGSQSGLGVTGRKASAWRNTTKPVTCKACLKREDATETPASEPEYRETVTSADGTTENGACSAAHALTLLRTALRRGYRVEATRHGGAVITRDVAHTGFAPGPGAHTVTLTPRDRAGVISRTALIDLTLIERGAWLTSAGRVNAGYLHSIPPAASARLVSRGLADVREDGSVTLSLTARLALIGQGHREPSSLTALLTTPGAL